MGGRKDEARAQFERALTLRRALWPVEADDAGSAAVYYCMACTHPRDEFAHRARLLERALDIRVRTSGEMHTSTRVTLGDLATAYAGLGRHADALAAWLRIERIVLHTCDDVNTGRLAWALDHAALAHDALGDPASAADARARAAALRNALATP